MSIKTALIEVLSKAGKPLHTKQITEQIISAGLWKSDGKTPEATISAKIYSDIKKYGDNSFFIKVAPQTFTIRTIQHGQQLQLAQQIERTELESVPKLDSVLPGFSFKDCAQKVLEEFGNKKPMHYKMITENALEKGWLVTEGKTPDATMYAQIITEIKHQQKCGDRPRFTQHGRGYVGLSHWVESGLAYQIEQHNHQVRETLLEKLLAMTPGQFEELISFLLAEMGFDMVEVTKLSGDGGIDVRGNLIVGGVICNKMAVQVKRWAIKNNVSSPVVQQVRGSLGIHEQGLIITTSDFSSGAIKEASQPNKTPIALMNGKQLVTLLMEHGIGVHRSTPDLFEIDESFGKSTESNL